VFLAAGWLARPREPQSLAPPVPSETELQQLARRAQRRALENTTAYFASLAGDVRSSLAAVTPGGSTGIVWDDHRIVTGPLPDASAPTLTTTAGKRETMRTVCSPRLPVTVLAAAGPLGGATVARRDASFPGPGEWIAAVWLTEQTPAFVPASFLQARPTKCGVTAATEIVSTASLLPPMVGGGLFDLDGNLLAVILPCGDRIAAMATRTVEEMIAAAGTVQERLLARHGLLIGPLSQDERRYFDEMDGLLVREVWRPVDGGDAILPGDTVTSLNGRPVTTLDDLQPMTEADGAFELGVRRGAKTRTVPVGTGSPAGRGVPPGADIGLELEPPARGFRIDSVQPEGRMARAGVRPGDRLVRINGTEPASLRQAERAIAGDRGPMLIDVERDGRRVAIAVP
jgi:S1-C subfamily serine protease